MAEVRLLLIVAFTGNLFQLTNSEEPSATLQTEGMPSAGPDHCGCYQIVRGKKELKAAVSCESDDSYLCCHVKSSRVGGQKPFCCVDLENMAVPFVDRCNTEGWSIEDLYYRLKNRSKKKKGHASAYATTTEYSKMYDTACVVVALTFPLMVVILVLLLAKKVGRSIITRKNLKDIKNASVRSENRKYSDYDVVDRYPTRNVSKYSDVYSPETESGPETEPLQDVKKKKNKLHFGSSDNPGMELASELPRLQAKLEGDTGAANDGPEVGISSNWMRSGGAENELREIRQGPLKIRRQSSD